jgi:hypothetical protein
MDPTFAQVCSKRVTKEYRLSNSAFRVFVNPGVPILAFLALDSTHFETRAEQPLGVDASLDEVYSESAVAETAGAVPSAVKSL